MTADLDIGISLPRSYITQKAALLAVTGSGKSYGVGDILEEFCEYHLPFVMIDVMGAHHGLKEKYKVIVFGGRMADYPITHKDGIKLGTLIVELNLSCIIDVAEMADEESQVLIADLLDTIFSLNRTPRHLFIEEAEVFAPQQGFQNSKESLRAMNKVMKRGRAIGLGMTLISQRPADLNKKTLSQSQCTFFMHLEASQDLHAVEKMVKQSDNYKELLAMIPKFQQGEALLYSPSWLKRVEKFKFRKRRCYHSGDTPALGEEQIPPPYLPVNTSIVEPYFVKKEVEEEEVVEPKELIIQPMSYKLVIPIVVIAITVIYALGWIG